MILVLFLPLTLQAKAVAHESQAKFFNISASSLTSKWVSVCTHGWMVTYMWNGQKYMEIVSAWLFPVLIPILLLLTVWMKTFKW